MNQTDPLDEILIEFASFFKIDPDMVKSGKFTKEVNAAKAAINAEIAKAVSDFSKVNRVEVIDHTKSLEDGGGRTVVAWKKQPLDVQINLQDDNRTLKLFVSEPHE